MKKSILIPIFLSLCLYFSFGFYHIAKFETADEHYWIYDPIDGRIHDYWEALSKKDWAGTRINNKPGVMLAYVSGIGIFFEDNLHKKTAEPADYESVFSSAETEKINLAFRLPLLIFNSLFSLFFFWAIKRLTQNEWLAATTVILILLNPIIIGVSQIINPDSLLWIFSFASLISFLNYLKYSRRKDAFLCALFLGFSLLSKYSAVIFIPFLFITMLIYLLQESDQFEFSKKTKLFTLNYAFILLEAFTIFALLMPAVIINPAYFYYGTIGFKGMAPIFWSAMSLNLLLFLDAYFAKSKYAFALFKKVNKFFPYIVKTIFFIIALMFCLVLANWSIGNNLLNIKGINFDAGRTYPFRRQDFIDKLFLEAYPLVFSLTPLALLSIVALWIKGIFKPLKHSALVFVASSFLIVFYAAVLKQDLLVNIRYSVMLYPLLMFVAAFSINEFILEKIKENYKFAVLSGIIILSSISLWLIKPYYFNYTNDLLPKDKIITGAWGYGGYEAAQYLNALPNSKEITVWSDYWGVCYFFDGVCVKSSGYKNFTQRFKDKKIDYFVMTRRGEIINNKIWNTLRENSLGKPVWEINIDNRPKNFVKIYKSR